MNIINRISGAIADIRHSSEVAERFNDSYDEICKYIPPRVTEIIDAYYLENEALNQEMNRIFQAEGWIWPLSSPRNQQFANRFLRHITALTIPTGAEKHLEKIAARIKQLPNLSSITIKVWLDPTVRKNIEALQQISRQNFKKIKHLLFDIGTTLASLNAVTTGLELESLRISYLARRSEPEVGIAEADAKRAQDSFESIIGRQTQIRKLEINSAGLRDIELSHICQSCIRIEQLHVNGNYQTLTHQSLPFIAHYLTSLVSLDISSMSGLKSHDLVMLSKLPLKTLKMKDCFTEKDIGILQYVRKIPTLENLDISAAPLSLNDLYDLSCFKGSNLKILTMSQCAMDRELPNAFNKKYVYYFARCIGNIDSLEELDIRGSHCEYADFDYITGILKKLRKLYCGGWCNSSYPNDDEEGVTVKDIEVPHSAELIALKEKRLKENPSLSIQLFPIKDYKVSYISTAQYEITD